jgi:hypothetical protein
LISHNEEIFDIVDEFIFLSKPFVKKKSITWSRFMKLYESKNCILFWL